MTQVLLTLGIPVFGFSLPAIPDSIYARGKAEDQIEECFGDIANFDLLKSFVQRVKPTAIVHMAAQPLVLQSYKTPRETFETNGMGTVNILEVARQVESVKQVIVVTTDKVYKNENLGRRFIESDPLEGKDPYSASKVASEAAVSAWKQIASVEGKLQITSVRAGNVIGGGDWSDNRLLPDIIRSLIAKESIIVRNPESTRPWQHVLDPIVGYLLTLRALQDGNSIEALNFGPDEKSLTALQVAKIANDSWEEQSQIIFPPKSSGANLESTFLELDSRQARSMLNWQPRWTQSEAITGTISWWKRVLLESTNVQSATRADIEDYFGTKLD